MASLGVANECSNLKEFEMHIFVKGCPSQALVSSDDTIPLRVLVLVM